MEGQSEWERVIREFTIDNNVNSEKLALEHSAADASGFSYQNDVFLSLTPFIIFWHLKEYNKKLNLQKFKKILSFLIFEYAITKNNF